MFVWGGGVCNFFLIFIFLGGGQREWLWGRMWPKNHKFALLSEYLAADLSPDASPDALAIINIREIKQKLQRKLSEVFFASPFKVSGALFL